MRSREEQPNREREVFEGALEHAPSEARARYVERMCAGDRELLARVRALLDAHEVSAGFLPEQPALAVGPEEQPGDRIDRYRLIERIGEGGWGVVWRAEQESPVRREVALKIVKLGMDTRNVIARFEAERQALAMMDHPHIATVLDAGATDTGRPYFVMEHVDGLKITAYCDQRRLTIRERLTLFERVCLAVQHAHQKGIMHRDIKPSNILVAHRGGKPHPVVIDFGIAKATGGERLTDKTIATGQGQLLGTPAYMSPEQAWSTQPGDIDTRTDIYSLGVVLYELLAGSPPFTEEDSSLGAIDKLRRRIGEEDPAAPSGRVRALGGDDLAQAEARLRLAPGQLAARLRGDLDAICLKCLAKERDRRYETANGLAMDLRRHLDDEPIVARAPSVWYRLRKFARRHRITMALAGFAALSALALSAVGLYSYVTVLDARDQERRHRLEAEQARADAEARSQTLEQVAGFQARMLRDIDVAEMGARLRGDILAEAETALGREGMSEADEVARIEELETLLTGVNFTNAAARSLEQNVVERALDTIRSEFDDEPAIRAQLLQTAGTVLYSLGRYPAAAEVHQEALDIRRELPGEQDQDMLESLMHMGAALHEMGRFAEAEAAFRDAVAIARELLGEDHYLTLKALEGLGGALDGLGRYEESAVYKREALDGFSRVFGDEHAYTLTAKYRLAYPLRQLGRLEESAQYSRAVIEGRRRAPDADERLLLRPMQQLSLTLLIMEEWDEAEPYIHESLELSRRILGDAHGYTLESLGHMAALLDHQGRHEEADHYRREIVRLARSGPARGTRREVYVSAAMGQRLLQQGELVEAEAYAREALELAERLFGPQHLYVAHVLETLAHIARAQGRLDEAEALYRNVVDIRREVSRAADPHRVEGEAALAGLLVQRQQYDEAKRISEELLTTLHDAPDAQPHELARAHNVLGVIYQDLGQFEQAETQFIKAIEHCRANDDTSTHLFDSMHHLARLYRDKDDLDLAENHYREALAVGIACLGEDHEHVLQAAQELAHLLHHQDRLEEAEAFMRKALDGRTRNRGEQDPQTVQTMHYLGTILHGQGKFAEAEALYRHVVGIRREILRAADPHRTEARAALARLLIQQQRYDEAKRISEELLTTLHDVPDAQPHELARAHHTLGVIYQDLGQFEQAETQFIKAIEHCRANDDTSTHLFYSMHHLARLYRDKDELDHAENYYREALAVGSTRIGDGHEHVLQAAQELAHLLHYLGLQEESEALYLEVVERHRVLDEDHPQIYDALLQLARIAAANGDLNLAEQRYRDALAFGAPRLGQDNPHIAQATRELGGMLRRQGRMDDAEAVYRPVLEGRLEILGKDAPENAPLMLSLGDLLLEQGRLDEAEPLLLEALRLSQETLGGEHMDTLQAHICLGHLRHRQQRPAEAEAHYRAVMEVRARTLGKGDPGTLATTRHVADMLWQQGKRGESEMLLRDALEHARQQLGSEDFETIEVRQRLARTLRDLGKFDEAEATYMQVIDGYQRIAAETGNPRAYRAYSRLPEALTGCIWTLLGGFPDDPPRLRQALELAEEAHQIAEAHGGDTPATLAALARVQSRNGLPEEAHDTQRRALERIPTDHPSYPEFQATLREYEAALAQRD